MPFIVQKYGGSTVDSTAKIKDIALRIKDQKTDDLKMVIVVSAMGKTTDRLLGLAHELSESPTLKEMDMLLNTGEMVSMSLLSIALNEAGCPSTGLCGYQAGIQTDQFFSNASISEIRTEKIESALRQDLVAVVAGFQGQNKNGELTTLGRGGSDTTAIAIAAAMKADRCEILKDVSSIFSADPRIVPEAFPIHQMNYDQLLEITFWGAKVLQYRSAEIAKHFQIPLYVGPAHARGLGTEIINQTKELDVIEDSELLSLNSHEVVLQLDMPGDSLGESLKWLKLQMENRQIPFPQILHSEKLADSIRLFLTGPEEIVESLTQLIHDGDRPMLLELSSVTATCRGSTRPETIEKIISALERTGIQIATLLVSSMSVTVFIDRKMRIPAIELLHQLMTVKPVPQLVRVRS